MRAFKKKRTQIILAILLVFVVVIAIAPMRQVFAQGILNQLFNIVAKKDGFEYSQDSQEFVFSKITPNYAAYVGDYASGGGHRIRLALDSSIVEFAYVNSTLEQSILSGTPDVGHVAGVQTSTNHITADQQQILDKAQEILTRNSSPEASGSAENSETQDLTLDERLVLEQANEILKSSTTSSQVLGQNDVTDVNSPPQPSYVSIAQLVETAGVRKILFKDISDGIDMEYILNEGGIGQEIILQNKDSAKNSFTFSLDTKGLIHKDMGKKGVWYFFANRHPLIRMPKGFAKDASGAFTNDVNTRITTQGSISRIIITLPFDWLADPNRQYPVKLYTGLEVIPELRGGFPGATEKRQFIQKELEGISKESKVETNPVTREQPALLPEVIRSVIDSIFPNEDPTPTVTPIISPLPEQSVSPSVLPTPPKDDPFMPTPSIQETTTSGTLNTE